MEIGLASRLIAGMSGIESLPDPATERSGWQAAVSNDITTLAQLAQDDVSLPDHDLDPFLDSDCRHAALVALIARVLDVDPAWALEVGLCAELFHAAAFSNDDFESYRRPHYAAHGGIPPMRQDSRRLVTIAWCRRSWHGRLDRSFDDIFAEPERVALAVRAWYLWAGSIAMASSSLPRLLGISSRLQAGAIRLLTAGQKATDSVAVDHAIGLGLHIGRLWALERLHAMGQWNRLGQTEAAPHDDAEEALYAALCRKEAAADAEAALGLSVALSMPQGLRLTLDEFIKSQHTRVLRSLDIDGGKGVPHVKLVRPQGQGAARTSEPAADATNGEQVHVL